MATCSYSGKGIGGFGLPLRNRWAISGTIGSPESWIAWYTSGQPSPLAIGPFFVIKSVDIR